MCILCMTCFESLLLMPLVRPRLEGILAVPNRRRAREMEYGVRMVLFPSGTTFATCVTPRKQLYSPNLFGIHEQAMKVLFA